MTTLRDATAVSGEVYDHLTGRSDPQQRFRLYRLCQCEPCGGTGKVMIPVGPTIVGRCGECRGEGKTLDLVATAGNAEAVGTAIISLAREGEFSECPVGILDTEGEPNQKWLISPWLPSPRNISDAGRTLAGARYRKGESSGSGHEAPGTERDGGDAGADSRRAGAPSRPSIQEA